MKQPSQSQGVTFYCTCGKLLWASSHQAESRVKCSGCGKVILMSGSHDSLREQIDSPNVVASGFGTPTLVALWSIFGFFVLCSLAFLAWYSHVSRESTLAAANQHLSEVCSKASSWIDNEVELDGEVIELDLLLALRDSGGDIKNKGQEILERVRQKRLQMKQKETNNRMLIAARDEQARERVRVEQATRQADAIWIEAQRLLDANQVAQGMELLKKYLVNPHAADAENAQRLLVEHETAISDSAALESLTKLSDVELDNAKKTHQIGDGKVTHPALLLVRSKTIARVIDQAVRHRQELQLAEMNRREVERLAANERKRIEDARRAEANEARIAERRSAILKGRKEREAAGKLEYDFEKSEFARKRLYDYFKNAILEGSPGTAGNAVLKFGHALDVLNKLGELYLLDKFNGNEIESLINKPLLDKNGKQLNLSVRDACEEFASEYGAMQCKGTSFTFRWIWNEAKTRIAEERELGDSIR